MKNLIFNFGKTLSRAEQKQVQGGKLVCCISIPFCPSYNENACLIIGNTCMYTSGGEGSC